MVRRVNRPYRRIGHESDGEQSCTPIHRIGVDEGVGSMVPGCTCGPGETTQIGHQIMWINTQTTDTRENMGVRLNV